MRRSPGPQRERSFPPAGPEWAQRKESCPLSVRPGAPPGAKQKKARAAPAPLVPHWMLLGGSLAAPTASRDIALNLGRTFILLL